MLSLNACFNHLPVDYKIPFRTFCKLNNFLSGEFPAAMFQIY